MRPAYLLAALTAVTIACSVPATATEADDVPWDEIDRILKEDQSGAATVAAPVAPPPAAAAGQQTAQTMAEEPEPRYYDGPEDPVDVEANKSGTFGETEGTGTETDAASPAASDAEPAGAAVAEAQAQTPRFTLPFAEYFATKAATTLSGHSSEDRDAVAAFYESNGQAALWVDDNGLTDDAAELLSTLADADDWGLRAADYGVEALSRLAPAGSGTETLTDADIKLSLAAVAYARDARGGRIPDPTKQLSSYLDRKPRVIETGKLLSALSGSDDKAAYLLSLHPKHEQFERLRQALISARNKPAEVFEPIPRGALLKPGQSHPHIALIRARLKVPDPGMKPDGTAADATYYDAALAGAVTRYKEANGLTPVNTTITRALREALNAVQSVNEAQLIANMEQWRWMPDDLGDYHVAVNVPEFTVRVVNNGEVIHEERVITGKTDTQTPIFSDRMRSITFQPVWNVPQSIIVNELLPGLRAGRNPIAGRGLVAKRNGRFVDPWNVDWYSTDIRNFHIYQPPGPGNALGVVKFMFPNKHAVYLHDTPSKNLFASPSRTFSHGCVRVRDPVRFAEVLMSKDRGWGPETVKEMLTRGPEDNDVVLQTPIPIHLTYFTAWVDDGGEIKTFADIYGHERRIVHAVNGEWTRIAKHADHLAPVKVKPAQRPRQEYSSWDFYGSPPPNDRRRQRPGTYAYGYDDRPDPRRRNNRQVQKKPQGGFFDQLFGN